MRSTPTAPVFKHTTHVSIPQPRSPSIPYPVITFSLAFIFVFAMMLTLCGVTIGRIVPGSGPVSELPENLLPGNVAPVGAVCDSFHDGSGRCRYLFNTEDEPIYLVYDGTSRVIASVMMWPQNQTIGDLILTWGAPVSLAQYGSAIDVFWLEHSAHLSSCVFGPTSRVEWIRFGPDAEPASPWHGFSSSKWGCE